MNEFRIFTRRWWKDNPSWPNGLEPYAGGRKTTIDHASTYKEAQEICQEYNDTHDAGRYSVKAEFERE